MRFRLFITIAIAGLVLSGCASTVNGIGTTTAKPSSTAPSTSLLPPAPAGNGSNQPASAGTHVTVNDAQAHLHVRMIATSTRQVTHINNTAATVTVYLHIVRDSSAIEEAATETYSVDLPPAEVAAVLSHAVGSFAGSSGFIPGTEQSTTFRGHPAETAPFTGIPGTSDIYELEVVPWTSTRLYIFFARAGADFRELTSSFQSI